MKKIISIILIIAMSLTMLVGCGADENTEGTSSSDGQTVTKESVTIMGVYKSESVDPASGVGGDNAVSHAIFDGLVRVDNDGKYAPALAERWEDTDDGKSVTYYLRKDVTFHDGSTFDADDVIYTLDTMLSLPLFGGFLQSITLWEKVDEYTVKITKGAPYQNINGALALAFMIVPEERADDVEGFAAKPVGTGAYEFVSYDIDGTVTLVANENYFGEKAQIKNATVKPPIDPSTAVVALENGEVELVPNIPAAQLPIIEGNDDLTVATYSGAAQMLMYLMGDYLNDDVNLRKAIQHGINPQNIIAIAEEGMGTPVKDLLPESALGENFGASGFEGYNEELAKEFLDKSNYDGKEIMINIQSIHVPLAQSIQADLEKIGIKTGIEQLDAHSWTTKVINGEAELVPTLSGVLGATIEDFLYVGSSAHPYFGAHMGGTEEYDALVAKIRAEGDVEKRQAMLADGLKMLNDLSIVLPLYETVSNFAHSSELTGIYPIRAATGVFYLNEFKPAN